VSSFNIDGYLQRIGMSKKPSLDVEGLAQVVSGQLRSIPFENFDILLGRPISLETATLVDKLINRNRGGYCFELNGLLYLALSELGFKVTQRLGRILLADPSSGRTHLLLEVEIDTQRWVCDVGFGASVALSAPARLEQEQIFIQGQHDYRFIHSDTYGWLLQSRKSRTSEPDEWKSVYGFDEASVLAGDLAIANHYTSTHPSMFFATSRVASITKHDRRVSLFDFELTVETQDNKTVSVLNDDSSYLHDLNHYFGIELDVPYDQLTA
jgi:N-hydroxyarylamine O-acetyltransferase